MIKKWAEIFPDPDAVGESEYRAIYECSEDALGSIRQQEGVAAQIKPEAELSEEEIEHAAAMMDSFIGHARSIKKALMKGKTKR